MAMPAAQRFLTCRSASSRSEGAALLLRSPWGGGARWRSPSGRTPAESRVERGVDPDQHRAVVPGARRSFAAVASSRAPGQGAVRATRPPSYVPRGLLGSKLPHRSTARAGWPTWLEALSTAECICRCTLDTMTACRLLPLGSRWRPRTGSGWPACGALWDGNRPAYLRATLPVMESLARAERLRELQARNAGRAAAAGHDYKSLLAEIRQAYKGGKPAR